MRKIELRGCPGPSPHAGAERHEKPAGERREIRRKSGRVEERGRVVSSGPLLQQRQRNGGARSGMTRVDAISGHDGFKSSGNERPIRTHTTSANTQHTTRKHRAAVPVAEPKSVTDSGTITNRRTPSVWAFLSHDPRYASSTKMSPTRLPPLPEGIAPGAVPHRVDSYTATPPKRPFLRPKCAAIRVRGPRRGTSTGVQALTVLPGNKGWGRRIENQKPYQAATLVPRTPIPASSMSWRPSSPQNAEEKWRAFNNTFVNSRGARQNSE